MGKHAHKLTPTKTWSEKTSIAASMPLRSLKQMSKQKFKKKTITTLTLVDEIIAILKEKVSRVFFVSQLLLEFPQTHFVNPIVP